MRILRGGVGRKRWGLALPLAVNKRVNARPCDRLSPAIESPRSDTQISLNTQEPRDWGMQRGIIVGALIGGIPLALAAQGEDPLTHRVIGGRPAAGAAIGAAIGAAAGGLRGAPAARRAHVVPISN